ncbi:hypothetical protein [Salinarchaeum laminariae]|uniref:hypothetical protein n=1 Tax=Salinarchaeum laminariae TaxID=869888 RepID=UPI0020BF5DF6|nr:hypothetical protein [Salinarchaeum laminariae]
MNRDDDRAGDEYSQPRVPAPLRDRVHELFVAERGYEPASFQEALSVAVDLAAQTQDSTAESRTNEPGAGNAVETDTESITETDAGTEIGANSEQSGPSSHSSEGTEIDRAPSTEPIDAVVDEPALDSPDGESVSFDEYVDGLEETRQDPSPSVESILDTEHADSVVRELAAEVLEEMTQDAFQELEHGVDHGVGAGVTDGMGSTATADGSGTAPSDTTGDGVPDSLTADPKSDCAVCGRSHPVSVLHTTILEDEGSVALVCPSCAE